MTRRRRTVRPGVRLAEKAAALFIRAGGIGTIAAVSLIFVFLAAVVWPLFRGADVEEEGTLELSVPVRPSTFAVDEYRLLAAELDESGVVRVVSLLDGNVLREFDPFEEHGLSDPRAWSTSSDGRSLAFALPDGRLVVGNFGFTTAFPKLEDLPEDSRTLPPGAARPMGDGILQRTQEGTIRLQRFRLEVSEPYELEESSSIRTLAHTGGDGATAFCALTDDGRLLYLTLEERLNFLTGETRTTLVSTDLGYRIPEDRAPPAWVLLTGHGDNALLVWPDGRLERLDLRDPEEASRVETVDLIEAEGVRVTALSFLLGNNTLVVGRSDGGLDGWFRAKPEDAPTADGIVLVRGHHWFDGEGPAVRSIAPSPRSRMFAAGFEDGSVRVFQATTEQELARIETPHRPVLAARIAPKEDGLIVLGGQGISSYAFEPYYPEATWRSLFSKVWYEGYPEPAHIWQAESATDEFEPKLGFAPLIFGTLKATVYSLLFGAPLALLAAIFTSEFLDRRLRTPVKSTIEMMASLPSVVLGFLAGAVIAPFAEGFVPATLAVFVTVPAAFLFGAHLWQLLPAQRAVRWSGLPRLAGISLALLAGIAGALEVGPWMERVLFEGNIQLWLDGHGSRCAGAWALLFLPVSALVVAWIGGRWSGPWFLARSAGWSRSQSALAALVRFAVGAALTFGLAILVGWCLESAGFDPRGGVVGTYVQRNALVVGFVMGFAIIPIIYTLAEDALNSVPEHLRLASLAAGATPWQTAVRIIVPTAMSGLFSALMIGLGRAVGETMIVLMATGNTPVMEWNVFNGFRTLSANIAVELPEAVKGGTHYRALFLAALVLFGMTFVLNTIAELVRQRFRKRSYQL